MSSINGINGSGLAEALRVAQQNKQSVVTSSSGGASSTEGLVSKLNSLYGSDGSNNASSKLGQLADLLGVDTSTLTSELQSKNAGKLLEDQMMLKSLSSFDSEASSDTTDTDSSSGEEGGDTASLLQNLSSSSGNVFDSKL